MPAVSLAIIISSVTIFTAAKFSIPDLLAANSDKAPIEPIAAPHDLTGRTVGEMRGEDCRALFGRMLQKPAPGGSRLLGMRAKCSVPIRAKHLQRLMHDVAAE